MSFILEALKKSEAQRSLEASEAQRPFRIRHRPQPRRPLWLVVLLVPLVMVSLGLLWWMGRDGPTARPAEPTAVQTQPDQLPGESLAEPPITSAAKPAPLPRVLEQAAPGPAQPTEPAATERATVKSAPAAAPIPVRQENNDRTASTAWQAVELRQESQPAAAIATYGELSAGVKQRLAKPKISLHVYSAVPERRMVRVDGRLLRQGERLPNGLQVYAIEPEQTLFRYSGQVFRLARTNE